MRILGIDPGYALVGWAIVDFGSEIDSDDCLRCASESPEAGDPNIHLQEYGVVTTDPDLEIPDRLLEIHDDVTEIIKSFKPNYMGIETLLFHKNIKTAMAVSEARGVITLAAKKAQTPVKNITPLQVKSSISGYGKADKKQVQKNVKLICGLDEVPKPDDAADAVAVAISAYGFVSKLK